MPVLKPPELRIRLFLLILLLPIITQGQVVATLKLADGNSIVNAPSGRDWVDFKVIPTGGFDLYEEKDTLVIDDSDQIKMTYYGDWSISTENIFGSDGDGCNCSFARTSTDSLVFMFTNATRVEWWGEQMTHQGFAYIYLNGVHQEGTSPVDTYSPVNDDMVLNWYKDGLDTAEIYKLKIVVGGVKNEAASNTYVVSRGFRLINTVESSDPVEPPIEPPNPPDPPIDTVPPPIVEPPVVIYYEFSIIRSGRFQVFIDGVQDEGEHNEYEKAIEHALRVKTLNPVKNVIIKSPFRRIEIK